MPRAPSLMPEVPEDEDIVDPRDVMHEDLAEFYINAAATTNIARRTAVYRLHEVMDSRISNIKFNIWVSERTTAVRVARG